MGDAGKFRIMFAGGAIEFVQDLLGVGSQLKGGAAQHHHVRGITVGPASNASQSVDFIKGIGGTLGVVVELIDIMSGPKDAHATGKLAHCIGGDGHGLSVFSLGHQCADVEHA